MNRRLVVRLTFGHVLFITKNHTVHRFKICTRNIIQIENNEYIFQTIACIGIFRAGIQGTWLQWPTVLTYFWSRWSPVQNRYWISAIWNYRIVFVYLTEFLGHLSHLLLGHGHISHYSEYALSSALSHTVYWLLLY